MDIKNKPLSFYLLVASLTINLLVIGVEVSYFVKNSLQIKQTVFAAGTSHYVSPSGNDSGSGSQSQPWKTLKKATASAVPGDTITILSGTYYEKLAPVTSGTSGNYITYTASPGTVILNGSGVSLNSNGDGLVVITGKSYIRIQGLTLKNSSQSGVYIQPDASGVKASFVEISGLSILNSAQTGITAQNAQNLIVKNNNINYVKYSSGIGIWSSNQVLVDHNTIVNAHVESEANGGHEESLSIASTTNFEVSNNDVSMSGQTAYLGNEGIDVKEASRFGKVHHNLIHDYKDEGGALYIDAWKAISPSLSNIDIYDNYLRNTANGINIGSEQGGTAENINVYNNIVYNTGSVGIGIPGRSGDGLRRNINIYNNTVYQAQYNGGAGIYITSSHINNIVIRNNLVYFNNTNGEITAASRALLSNIKADHNLVYGPKSCSTSYPNCVEISNNPSGYSGIYSNTTADPKFVSLTTPDLHLTSKSPAVDKGVDLSPLVVFDYAGTPRPQGSAFDIGAYESINSPTLAPTSTPAPTIKTTPTSTPVVTNLIQNPSFESGDSPWTLDVANGTAANYSRDNTTATNGNLSGKIIVTTSASAQNSWYTQFFQDNLAIVAGKSYKVTFSAKSSQTKTIQVVIQKIGSPYTQYLNQNINLTSSWQKYSLVFNPTVSDANVKLTFFLAGNTGTTWFDGFYFGL